MVLFNDTTTIVLGKFSYTESEGISRRKQVSLANINIIGINFAYVNVCVCSGCIIRAAFHVNGILEG